MIILEVCLFYWVFLWGGKLIFGYFILLLLIFWLFDLFNYSDYLRGVFILLGFFWGGGKLFFWLFYFIII